MPRSVTPEGLMASNWPHIFSLGECRLTITMACCSMDEEWPRLRLTHFSKRDRVACGISQGHAGDAVFAGMHNVNRRPQTTPDRIGPQPRRLRRAFAILSVGGIRTPLLEPLWPNQTSRFLTSPVRRLGSATTKRRANRLGNQPQKKTSA